MRALALLFAVTTLAACAGAGAPVCLNGASPASMAELYFGRNIGGSPGVTDADWRRFVDEEVTPRFPDGLTVVDADGQWRDGGGVVRERSKVLLVVLTDPQTGAAKLAEAADAYKRRFSQQSVMTVLRPVCVSF